jgi:hypothetical protein
MTQDQISGIIRKIIEKQVIDALCAQGFKVNEDSAFGQDFGVEQDYENGLALIAKSYYNVQQIKPCWYNYHKAVYNSGVLYTVCKSVKAAERLVKEMSK